ncbi:hypothetical protein [Butyrivibrio sp. MB2005]|uniref:hypothetical protein n=1 Tax=Butyrivibrio sp. MB2005 TaxID=1280678 RepID=UPI000427B48A|nr:hypothetical protein [Butyrivibrio sp. MB2005]
MEKSRYINAKKPKIIDTIEYNGRYTDVSTIRTKIIAAGSIIIAAVALICAQLFWI